MSASDKIQQVGTSLKVVAGIYGHSGIGKTTFIGTSEVPTLIIRPPIDHTDSIIDPSNIDEYVANDWGEMDELMMDARSGSGLEKYKWLWLDSASLFQFQGLEDIWDTVTTEKPHRKRYGPDIQDYGINMWRLSSWMRHMIGTPGFNIGWTAHQGAIEGLIAPGEEINGPSLRGKDMPQQFCAMCNVVGRMFATDRGERKLQLRLTAEYFAKDQFNCIDATNMTKPTMPKLIKAISATQKGRKALQAGQTTPKRSRRKKTNKGR